MKKMYTKKASILRLSFFAAICLAAALLPRVSYGQTYYSTFPDTAIGKYSVAEPSGGTCNAPAIQDAGFFADDDLGSFAYFKGTITSALTCTNKNYSFKTYLNLPFDSASISGGPQAGFKIKIPSVVGMAALSQYLTIRTYLDNKSVETFTEGDVHPVDLSSDSTRYFVYANTTKRFNQVELLINDKIIPLNTDFEMDVFYGFASVAGLFPVTINNLKLTATNNNVTVAWQSVNETNTGSYRIEKSSNGNTYATVATIAAKGGSGAITYSYTDKTVSTGSYLYRVVAIDKDGASKTTNSVFIKINGKEAVLVVPSIVKAGQPVVINSSANGSYQVAVFDIQGRTIKQLQLSNGDRATINTAGLSAGTYIVKVVIASGTISQTMFIVN